jgi:hypothetical protein
MAGKHRIVARKERRALGELPRLAAKQLPNEHEWRAVRK